MSGTRGAATGAGTAGTGAGAAFVVLDRGEELGEAKVRGARGPSTIIEMMRHVMIVFEV
jgi:hypothetical protein